MPTLVLRLRSPDDVLRQRLSERESDRTDDVPDKIKRRTKTFEAVTSPVLRRYDRLGLVVGIDANRGVESVYEDISEVLRENFGERV